MTRVAMITIALFVGIGASSQQLYFPKGSLSAYPSSDSFKAEWYSTHLKALSEPSLFQLAQNPTYESYRFVWLRTFHHPVIVRLDLRTDGIVDLTLKVSNGAGGYKPGRVIQNLSRPLTREETNMFFAKLEKVNFWNLPSYENEGTEGEDGSQWIIEGVRNGKYHVVDRWTPGGGPVRELGITLALGLADLKIPKDDLY